MKGTREAVNKLRTTYKACPLRPSQGILNKVCFIDFALQISNKFYPEIDNWNYPFQAQPYSPVYQLLVISIIWLPNQKHYTPSLQLASVILAPFTMLPDFV